MAELEIKDFSILVSSLVAVVLALFSIYKIFYLEKKIRERKVTVFKDENIENSIRGMGEMVADIQRVRVIFKNILDDSDGDDVDNIKGQVKKSKEEIEGNFMEILSHGFLHHDNVKTKDFLDQIHRSKAAVIKIINEAVDCLDNEKVRKIGDISDLSINNIRSARSDLKERYRDIGNVQLQLLTKYGRGL